MSFIYRFLETVFDYVDIIFCARPSALFFRTAKQKLSLRNLRGNSAAKKDTMSQKGVLAPSLSLGRLSTHFPPREDLFFCVSVPNPTDACPFLELKFDCGPLLNGFDSLTVKGLHLRVYE